MSRGSHGGRESKHVTRERILPEHRLRLRRQTVEPLAHIGGTGRQPYPSPRRQTIHRRNSITCRRASELTSPRRRTRDHSQTRSR
jgi:hypothetical protein